MAVSMDVTVLDAFALVVTDDDRELVGKTDLVVITGLGLSIACRAEVQRCA
jgi:hypothetical protein